MFFYKQLRYNTPGCIWLTFTPYLQPPSWNLLVLHTQRAEFHVLWNLPGDQQSPVWELVRHRTADSTPDSLNQKLHFNKIPRDLQAHENLRNTVLQPLLGLPERTSVPPHAHGWENAAMLRLFWVDFAHSGWFITEGKNLLPTDPILAEYF